MRAPRLLGAPAAMDLMLTGRALSAAAAKAMGLVDRVVDSAVLLDEAVKLAERGTVERRLHVLHLPVLQRHLEPAQRAPRGDVAAHHAGTDDVHLADARFLAAEALEPVHQEEHAHEVVRRRRAGQFHHRLRLGLQRRVHGQAAGTAPRVDQRERRRVVGLARLARGLGGDLRREDRARRRRWT